MAVEKDNAVRQFTDLKLFRAPWVYWISGESARQLQKWGTQTHTLFEWVTYTAEELGELAKAVSEYVYRGASKEQIRHEAVQVATLAIKIAEMAEFCDEGQDNDS